MRTVTICFLVKGNEVLLTPKKKGFGEGFLNGYGGGVEGKETIVETALREIEEESTATSTSDALEKVAVIDFFEGGRQIFECHVFFVHSWSGEPKETAEMGQPEVHDLQAIPFDRMWKSDRVWMPVIFRGERIQAKAYYNEGMKGLEKFEYVPLVA